MEFQESEVIPASVIDFFDAWYSYEWNAAEKRLKDPEVLAWLSEYKPFSSLTLYRGFHIHPEMIDRWKASNHGTEVGEKFKYTPERHTSWSTDREAAKQFMFTGEDGEYGILVKHTFRKNDILAVLGRIDFDEIEKHAKVWVTRENEREVIVKPGSYEVEIIEICKDTDISGKCNESAYSIQLTDGFNMKVLKNPTEKQVLQFWKNSQDLNLRYIIDPEKNMYVWDAYYLTHYDMMMHLGVKPKEVFAAGNIENEAEVKDAFLKESIDSSTVLQYLKQTDPYTGGEHIHKQVMKFPSYELKDIPVDQIDNHIQAVSLPMQGDGFGESDEEIATEYSELASDFPPIIVKPKGDRYQTLDGAHRARAAFLRGDKTIKAYVANTEESLDESVSFKAEPQEWNHKSHEDLWFIGGKFYVTEEKPHRAWITKYLNLDPAVEQKIDTSQFDIPVEFYKAYPDAVRVRYGVDQAISFEALRPGKHLDEVISTVDSDNRADQYAIDTYQPFKSVIINKSEFEGSIQAMRQGHERTMTEAKKTFPDMAEFKKLAKDLKADLYVYGSVIYKGIKKAGDIDLVLGDQAIDYSQDPEEVKPHALKALIAFAKKHDKVIDAFFDWKEGQENGKVMVHPNGKHKYFVKYTGEDFFACGFLFKGNEIIPDPSCKGFPEIEESINEAKGSLKILPKDSEIYQFYWLADREASEQQWEEDAKEQFDDMDDDDIDSDIEDYFDNHGSWNGYDQDEWLEHLQTLSPEEQKKERFNIFLSHYIYTQEEEGDSSEVYFENPRILKNVTLYRFTNRKPEEVMSKGFRGYGPNNLGLTHWETPASGDLAFGFEKKDLDLDEIEEMKSKYGSNVFQFKVPYAIKVYHRSDEEEQVVFDVTTVSGLKLLNQKQTESLLKERMGSVMLKDREKNYKVLQGKISSLTEIIKKIGPKKYRLYSKKGKNLGTYPSKAGAEKREKQVQFFKHQKESLDRLMEAKGFGKYSSEYIEQAISYFENLCDEIEDIDAFATQLTQKLKSAPVKTFKPTEAHKKFLRKHGETFATHPWSSGETKLDPKAAPSFAVEFDGKFYCVDGQHRLNHRIALELPVPVIVLNGDWMKKYGVTSDCFNGKIPKVKPTDEALYVDQIPGGKGDKLKPSDVDQDQLIKGIQVEMEHTDDLMIAMEIALDHLAEDPKYYDKLKKIHQEDTFKLGDKVPAEIVWKYFHAMNNHGDPDYFDWQGQRNAKDADEIESYRVENIPLNKIFYYWGTEKHSPLDSLPDDEDDIAQGYAQERTQAPPIILHKTGDSYEIVDGIHRTRAQAINGKPTILALVGEKNIKESLTENTASLLSKWDAIIKKPNFYKKWLDLGMDVLDDFRSYGADDYPPFWEPFQKDPDNNDPDAVELDYAKIKKFIAKAYKIARNHVAKNLKSQGSNLILYRCIAANDWQDIKLDSIGQAWGMTELAADCTLVNSGHGKNEYILTALVPLSAVLIDFSLALNLNPHTDESEIRLKPGARITITKIQARGTSENLLKEPVKGNTGYGYADTEHSSFGEDTVVNPETNVTFNIGKVQNKFKSFSDGIHMKGDTLFKKQNGKVVGVIVFASVSPVTEPIPTSEVSNASSRIDFIFVDPKYRHKGIAKELLIHAIKTLGVVEANLQATPGGDAVWKSIKGTPGITVKLKPGDEGRAMLEKEREYWGRQGAGGVIQAESTGRYLLNLRSQHVNEPGTWGTWGGMIDKGENPEEALKREIKEETGYFGEMQIKPLHTFTDGDFKFHNYLVTVPSEFDPRLSWESDDARWVTLDELPSPLHFGMEELLPFLESKTEAGDLGRSVLEYEETDQLLPADVIKAFTDLANKQRGEPEQAMIDIQHFHAGVLAGVVEHVGDLTHRMTEMSKWNQMGREYVLDKASKTFRWLTNPYGFLKEHNENIENNAKFKGMDEKEYRKKLDDLLEKYAKAHWKLPTYNRLQDLAKMAAVNVGKQRFANATDFLESIKRIAGDAELYEKMAREFKRDASGQLMQYDNQTTPLREDHTEGPAIDDFLQSRIHHAFTLVADNLCSLGYMDSDKRIALSSAIGDSLEAFRKAMDKKAPWAKKTKVDPGHSARMVLESLEAELQEAKPNWSVETWFENIPWEDNHYDLYPGYSKPEESDAEYYYSSKKEAQKAAKFYIGVFQSLPDPIPVFRVLQVDDPEEIDMEYIGNHWSFDKSTALRFGSENLSSDPQYLVSGVVKKNDVDWGTTLSQFMSMGGDIGIEDEIYIGDPTKVKVLKVEPTRKAKA